MIIKCLSLKGEWFKLIGQVACQATGMKRGQITLEIQKRVSLDPDRFETDFNELRIKGDTDLYDQWPLRKVPLTFVEGKAKIHVPIYERGRPRLGHGDLIDILVVYLDLNGVESIRDSSRELYRRD